MQHRHLLENICEIIHCYMMPDAVICDIQCYHNDIQVITQACNCYTINPQKGL